MCSSENFGGSSDGGAKLNAITNTKYVLSSAILIFAIVNIMFIIFDDNTKLAKDVHPALACVLIWLSVIWLAMLEGGQGALLGLPPIDKELYKVNHPTTYSITSRVHKGDNLDRYLMGRQFMVVVTIFVVNLAGSPIKTPDVFGFPEWYQVVISVSGFSIILMTAMIGQLAAQVNSSNCMLDFVDNYFAVLTVYAAMFIEFSGILHASYLIQMGVSWLAGKPLRSKEDPRTTGQSVFFWCRCILSVVIIGFGFAVTFVALLDDKTTMWKNTPGWVSIILFFFLMSIVGCLEGMQIAFFALTKMAKEDRGDNTFVKMTCKLLFRGGGENLPGFMVGRQVCVVTCYFIIARITTQNVTVGEGKNVFGIPDALQEFLNTGLIAAVIVTVLGSIFFQLVASAFPFSFLANPLTYVLLRICLLVELTGICAGSYVIAAIHKKLSGYQFDEVYVGTPEERAAEEPKFVEESIHVECGHLAGSSFPSGAHKVGLRDMDLKNWADTVHGQGATIKADVP